MNEVRQETENIMTTFIFTNHVHFDTISDTILRCLAQAAAILLPCASVAPAQKCVTNPSTYAASIVRGEERR